MMLSSPQTVMSLAKLNRDEPGITITSESRRNVWIAVRIDWVIRGAPLTEWGHPVAASLSVFSSHSVTT